MRSRKLLVSTQLTSSSLPDGGIEPFLEFAQYLMDLPDKDLPQVMSVSWGVNEQHVPKDYAKEICRLFGQLGARGMSIIVASGDQGPGYSCQSNDGKKKSKFLPVFPASCPYVTAVGGVESNNPERAVSFSSGGFSEYWEAPSWQRKDIKKYLDNNGKEFVKYFNKKGRGFPDVAAQAQNTPIMNHGDKQLAAGTRYTERPKFRPRLTTTVRLLQYLRQ